jgi:fructosamine-3-kinase
MTISLSREVARSERVGGGCINEGHRVEFADGGQAFVKTRREAAPGEYETEAAALRWLAEPGGVRLPEVIEVQADLLAIEWIDEGRLSPDGAEELGRGLAQMHSAGAEAFGSLPPGAPVADLRIGPIALPVEPYDDWPSLYAERLLMPLARQAGIAVIERVCERIHEIAGPAEPPSRLHGDLWGGNVLAGADGRAWLIDPAAYGGHREVDLAMLRLFGSPGPRVFDAYEEAAPLADGHEERVGLWQLFPLLVHTVLFGGGYRAQAESTARRYAG